MLDIDHFKGFNDDYGHDAGDTVLVKTAALIEGAIRKVDTAYRYGGEEFTVVLPDTDLEKAKVVAYRILEAFRNTEIEIEDNDKNTKNVSIKMSIGIAERRDTDGNMKEDHDHLKESPRAVELKKRSDKALYHVKETGRNGMATEDGRVLESGIEADEIEE